LHAFSLVAVAADNAYKETKLVSDPGLGVATPTVDPNLVNGWGLAFNPNGSPAWVADNGTSFSTLYDGNGTKISLEVSIPGKNPTGIVFFGGSGEFLVDGNASRFIFATENGTIDAWAPPPPPSSPPTTAVTMVNNSGAVYKGLALEGNGEGHFLYATDFHNAKIDVFDKDFKAATLACTFSDPEIPEGFAPFGIQNLNGNLYVTYAKQKLPAKEDDEAGPGNGFINVFDANGCLIRQVAKQGKLNSPWGLAIAPADFGKFSNSLLVGNFGNGKINAYDIDNGEFRGQLRRPNGKRLKIDGLWALVFGNGVQHQPPNVLFFTAGPNDEANGLYGRIEASSKK
jgi:uncharacterized protein (TIGR03118 family)